MVLDLDLRYSFAVSGGSDGMLDFDLGLRTDLSVFVQPASLHDIAIQFASSSFCLDCEGIAVEEDVVVHRGIVIHARVGVIS